MSGDYFVTWAYLLVRRCIVVFLRRRRVHAGGGSDSVGDAVGTSKHDEVPQQRSVKDRRHALNADTQRHLVVV